jgi:hypothetical protein
LDNYRRSGDSGRAGLGGSRGRLIGSGRIEFLAGENRTFGVLTGVYRDIHPSSMTPGGPDRAHPAHGLSMDHRH